MLPLPPSIAAPALSKLLDLASSFGLSPPALAADAGISRDFLADRDARVPLEALHRLWSLIVEVTGRRFLPLEVAVRYTPGDYGLVGFAAANSANLGEALGHLARYLRLWADEPRISLDGSRLILRYGARLPESIGLHCATEAAFAEILNAIRVLEGASFRPSSVSFAHPAPEDSSPYHEYFGCKVTFGASVSQMALTHEQLEAPLARADPQLGELLRSVANEALGKLSPPDSFLSTVREYLAASLQKGLPSARDAARDLHVSERTFRRRLEEEGTNFREILDETRAEMARAYVRDHRLPMAEVAFLLGFSDPSAFHRAFKRWTKKTPAAVRKGE